MMLKNFHKIFRSESLKRKILWTLGLILVVKFLSIIPVPGVDLGALQALRLQMEAQSSSGLSFFSALMGGGMANFSIILMGLSPYINASIILQLLTVVIPKLEAIKKEGEQGQRKINQYTRLLTVPLAVAQSYGMILLLNTLIAGQGQLINTSDFLGAVLPAMLFVTAGTVLLMWLGELVNEKGIGNGISLIIFAGVLAGVPGTIAQYLDQPLVLAGLFALTLGVIWVIIRFTEGYRKIPLIYTRTGRDERSYFPIRVNQAGMVPIIFAISLVTFPSIVGQILAKRGAGFSADLGTFLSNWFNPQNGSWLFIGLYFAFVLGFTFFYVSITFNAADVAENIQRRGGYIPGIRPGADTAKHLGEVSARLNVWGGGFLALIAVFPYLATKLNSLMAANGFYSLPVSNVDFIVSGAGLIIAVGTVLELMRRADVELKSYDYKRFQ